MWKILLTFISISCVSCQTNCPGFSYYRNNVNLAKQLNGEFFVIYTSSDYVLNCERISYTVGPNNNRTAYLVDMDGCCRRIDNFDESNPNYCLHDINPLTGCTHLKSKEKVQQKVIKSIGIGLDLCLIVAVCHPSRSGLLAMCRQIPSLSLSLVNQFLSSQLLVPTSSLKKVTQNDCLFDNNCFV